MPLGGGGKEVRTKPPPGGVVEKGGPGRTGLRPFQKHRQAPRGALPAQGGGGSKEGRGGRGGNLLHFLFKRGPGGAGQKTTQRGAVRQGEGQKAKGLWPLGAAARARARGSSGRVCFVPTGRARAPPPLGARRWVASRLPAGREATIGAQNRKGSAKGVGKSWERTGRRKTKRGQTAGWAPPASSLPRAAAARPPARRRNSLQAGGVGGRRAAARSRKKDAAAPPPPPPPRPFGRGLRRRRRLRSDVLCLCHHQGQMSSAREKGRESLRRPLTAPPRPPPPPAAPRRRPRRRPAAPAC